MSTPIQYPQWKKRKYTSYWDKYRALVDQGFTESEAHRMAAVLPQVYGPKH